MSSAPPSNRIPLPPFDNAPLPDLSERQEVVLSLIVREYIRTVQPVGSKTLVERFDLGVSSATVRNDMVALEQHGLIYAPHTSAGRVPTKQGYRYFVQRLLKAAGLTKQEQAHITQEFDHAASNVNEWPRIAAMTLSRVAQSAALVTPPRAVENQFKHLELINTQGRLVLMVVVLQGGSVHQQVLTLTETVPQDVLSRTAQIINDNCSGHTAEQVRSKTHTQLDALTREIGDLVADAMSQVNQQAARAAVRYGLSESLTSLSEDEAQQIVQVLEEEELLDDILREMLAPDQPDLRIVVAGEGRWENLSHLSMVLGRYGTPEARGAMAVLGPTRMRYGRAVSAVRYVAGLMSGLLGNVTSESIKD
ncbi:MAG: heat-inducible transcriptional repressor HrcA [Anaerolineae bacterium]|nr:heat-inducible transcriptional repressor HrcA [Anaerolineae bacterium]